MPERILNGLSYLRPNQSSERLYFPAANTAPDVNQGTVFYTASGGAVSISDFLNGEDGKIIYVCSFSSNVTTLVHGTNIFLSSSANYVMGSNDAVHLLQASGVWIQIGGGGGGSASSGAATDSPFVTFVSNGALTNERVLTAGTNVTISTSATAIFINATTGAGGGGSVAGGADQIQFNSGGAFQAAAGFTFNQSNGLLSAPRLEISSSNIIYAGISDSLQSLIDSASHGDAIMLPSGVMRIGTSIIVNKQIKIIGQGEGATVLDAISSNVIFFRISTDNCYVGNIKFVRSNTDTSTGILVEGFSNASFPGENIVLENLWMQWTNGTTGPAGGAGDGITMDNAGAKINNCLIQVSAVAPTSTDQTRGIFHRVDSNNTLSTTCRVSNTRIEVTHGAGDGGNQEIARGFMAWNNAQGSSFVNENFLQDVVIIVRAATNSQVEAFQNQGLNVISHVFNSFIDGDSGNNSLHADVRIADSANVYFYNTVLANNKYDGQELPPNIRGIGNFQGLNIDSASKPGSRSTSTTPDTNPGGITLEGGDGANNSIGTSGSGGIGARIDINLGNGGICSGANTVAAGGQGGYFRSILGNGGPQLTTSGTNIGGPGGYFLLQCGHGADASGGTTNRGGGGGSIYLVPGSGGTGATANGTGGSIYFSTDTRGTRIGRVFIGTSEGLASGSGVCLRNTDLQLSVASIASTTASGMVSTIVDSNNVLRINGNGSPFTLAGTPNIVPSYSGKFLYLLGNNAGDSLTLQDEINLPGSQLNLGGYNLQMNSGQAVLLMYQTITDRWEKIGDSFKKNFTIQTRIINSANFTSGDDDLLVYSLSAGQLGAINQSLDFKAWGVVGSNGTGKRIRFWFGTQPILDTGVLTENSGVWVFNATIVRSSPTLQFAACEFMINSASLVTYTATTEDLTTLVNLKVTGSSSTSSSNDIIQRGHRIHFYNTNG